MKVLEDHACEDVRPEYVLEYPGAVVHLGDCLDVLRAMPDESIDAVVTDPPYGLSNIKPVRITEAITAWAAGDRERVPDGRGFMGKAWDSFVPPPAVWDECLRVLKPGGHLAAFAGSRTHDLMGLSIRMAGFEIRDGLAWLYGSGFPKGSSQLKPAFEPVTLARKPLEGTVAANVLKWGTGALNIDGCRVGSEIRTNPAAGHSTNESASIGDGWRSDATPTTAVGRWPANVVLDESQADVLGDPSRFFYCAKASSKERPEVDGVRHPTVKPLALMRWIVRLVTPSGGLIVDPFAGSGTTIESAMLEGFNVVGVERETRYLPLIEQRINRATVERFSPGDRWDPVASGMQTRGTRF